MDGLFSWQSFTSFGPNPLEPGDRPPRVHRIHGSRPAALRHHVLHDCPRRPGVYGMVDVHGELIYVGKAKNLRRRLLSYFRRRGRDRRSGRIVAHTRAILWESAPSDFAASLRELHLIRRWRPRLNVQGQPGRYSHTFLCLGRRPAPHLFLSRRPPAGVLACFGPIPSGKKVRAAVSRLNDWYRLRDCPQPQVMTFAEQGELFPVVRAAGCIRYEIGTCLGPCASACTRSDYAKQVRAARCFLEGADKSPLQELERQMTAAATALQYERAAALRDRFEPLKWLSDRLERLRQARRQLSFVYPVQGWDDRPLWYLIHGGLVVQVLPEPNETAERQAAAAAIGAVYGQPIPRTGALVRVELDSVLLVAAWFRRQPEELRRVLPADRALALCSRTICNRSGHEV